MLSEFLKLLGFQNIKLISYCIYYYSYHYPVK